MAVIVLLPRTCSCRYNVVVFYKHEGGRRGRDRTTPKNLQLSVQCSCIIQTRGGAVVAVIVLLPRTCSCRYNVVVFYKHEGGRRGRNRTTPKNLQLSVQCSCILQTRGGPSWP